MNIRYVSIKDCRTLRDNEVRSDNHPRLRTFVVAEANQVYVHVCVRGGPGANRYNPAVRTRDHKKRAMKGGASRVVAQWTSRARVVKWLPAVSQEEVQSGHASRSTRQRKPQRSHVSFPLSH